MSQKPPKTYVVMRKSGRVMMFRGGLGADATHSQGPYFSILETIATELMSAGSDYDPPEKLFLNGKVVVDCGLDSLAYDYQRDKVAAREAASNAVANIHTPAWAPDDEHAPGYNPPGIDAWTVKKAGRR